MRCKLCELGRRQVVFGVGNPKARLMFVGEAPGEDEDRQGEPFVGRAGQLLTKIIEAISLTRDQVYIANVIKCRPPGNRNPEPDEVSACEPFLFQQIAIIKPRVIVALGKFAAQCLLRTTEPITRLRGREFEYRGATLIPTFHPAYLLRNPSAKREVWEDMKKVRGILLGRSRPSARRPSMRLDLGGGAGTGTRPAHLCGARPAGLARRRRACRRSARPAQLTGIVLGEAEPLDPSVEVASDSRSSTHAFVPPDVVSLARWVADYYLAGPGAALAAAVPPHGLTARVDASRRCASRGSPPRPRPAERLVAPRCVDAGGAARGSAPGSAKPCTCSPHASMACQRPNWRSEAYRRRLSRG